MNLNQVKCMKPLLTTANNYLAILYERKIIPDDLCICFITDTVSNNNSFKLIPYLTFSHNSKYTFSEILVFLNKYMPIDIMKKVELPHKKD